MQVMPGSARAMGFNPRRLNEAAYGIAAGIEHMRVDFGLEQDRGRRFALWALLYMLGTHLDLDSAFEDPADRDMARNFMDLMDRVEDD